MDFTKFEEVAIIDLTGSIEELNKIISHAMLIGATHYYTHGGVIRFYKPLAEPKKEEPLTEAEEKELLRVLKKIGYTVTRE